MSITRPISAKASIPLPNSLPRQAIPDKTEPINVAVVGAGPAGLMAAEVLAQTGLSVDVYDAMPTPGRKLLRAGIGGLNLTHSEAYERFCARYGTPRPALLQAALDRFPPDALRAWVHELGVETFVGSSGRVFPKAMKTAPLLRAWLERLRRAGVRLHTRHRWQGWDAAGALRFAHPDGEFTRQPHATILALGGASWPQLGSNGAWVAWLAERGVDIAPLQAANGGFDVAWSAHLREHFAGSPLKSVALNLVDTQGVTAHKQGELVLTKHGVEGGLIYAFSRPLRELLLRDGRATFTLDLTPGYSAKRVLQEVAHPRGARSLSSHLQSRLGLNAVKRALLYEVLDPLQMKNASVLAAHIKALPITVVAARPLAEAISSAGGVRFDALDPNAMLTALPGVFVAGEMLDWEAPTGGYLLTACLATGLAAGVGVLDFLGVARESSGAS